MWSVAKVYKLSSNETPLDQAPMPGSLPACGRKLELYPDGQALALRQAIAETQGLNISNILCGNGSDELLGLLCQTYLAPGDETIITEHGFAVYKIQTLAAGATPVTVKEKNERIDVDAILAGVTARTKIVSSPIRPTRPALICLLRKCAASMRACRSMFCWCSTPPMPNMCAATIMKPGWNSFHPMKTW